MTLTKQIMDVIDGTHVMNGDGLTAYHAAQAVKRALLKRDTVQQFIGVRTALKNYRVTVSYDAITEKTRVFRPDNKAELYLGKGR